MKIHKVRYQSDKSYLSLLNNHIIKKINELWPLVKDDELPFLEFQTL